MADEDDKSSDSDPAPPPARKKPMTAAERKREQRRRIKEDPVAYALAKQKEKERSAQRRKDAKVYQQNEETEDEKIYRLEMNSDRQWRFRQRQRAANIPADDNDCAAERDATEEGADDDEPVDLGQLPGSSTGPIPPPASVPLPESEPFDAQPPVELPQPVKRGRGRPRKADKPKEVVKIGKVKFPFRQMTGGRRLNRKVVEMGTHEYVESSTASRVVGISRAPVPATDATSSESTNTDSQSTPTDSPTTPSTDSAASTPAAPDSAASTPAAPDSSATTPAVPAPTTKNKSPAESLGAPVSDATSTPTSAPTANRPAAVRRLAYSGTPASPPDLPRSERSARKKGEKRSSKKASLRSRVSDIQQADDAPPLSEEEACFVTSIEHPYHRKGYVTPSIKTRPETTDIRGYTPRKYNPVKEAVRNERRKANIRIAKAKSQHRREMANEKRKTRYIRQSVKTLEAMATKIERIESAHKRKDLLDKVCSPTKIRANRLASHVSKSFKLHRKTVLRTKTGRRNQKKRISELTLRVLMFLQDPQWSVTYPGKKDLISCRYTMTDDNGKQHVWRKHIPKVVLTENLKELHRIYNEQNPGYRVNEKFFKGVRRRSQFIKCLNHAKADVCLCQKHQNFALKLRAIAPHTRLPQVPDTLFRKFDLAEFEKTLNEKKKNLPANIFFEEWKYTFIPISADPKLKKVCKKLRPLMQTVAKDKFIKALVAAYPDMKFHCDMAHAQHVCVREQRQNLEEEVEITIQMDFAQNWLVGFGEEVQSAFYAKDPVTLHPAVIHIRKGGKLLAYSVCLVSDDRRHDAGAVLAFVDELVKYIKRKFSKVKMVHFWSDSPSSQYRNISIFSLICRHLERYGINCSWSYFEAGHGKGPCDGVGAAAKKKADRHVKSGGNITNAAEFAAHNSKDGCVEYIVVPTTSTYRCRELLNWFVSPKKVVGTMKVHDVTVADPGKSIYIRAMSCYKECCWDSKALVPRAPQAICQTSYLCHFSEAKLFDENVYAKLAKKKIEYEREAKKKEQEIARQEAANAAKPKYNINDWVAALWCELWWVGQIKDITVQHEYVVKFMHALEGTEIAHCKLDWPEHDDISPIPFEDVLCKVAEPIRDICGSVFCFTLKKPDLQKVLDKYYAES